MRAVLPIGVLVCVLTSAASGQEIHAEGSTLALLAAGPTEIPDEHWLHDLEAPRVVRAQGGEGGDAGGGGGGDLAAKSQNPVSDLASLPLQNNFDFGNDPGNETRYVGNLQPVIPFKLNEDWNLIARSITPIVDIPTGANTSVSGLGDTVGQFFFSPRNDSPFIWGVGPSWLFPTATSKTLGAQDWGTGVTAVALVSQAPIVGGVLVNQIWGWEGTTSPFLVQPFFNYNLPKGWYLLAAGEATADWELPDDRRWVFVFGPGVGRVFTLGGQAFNVNTRFAPYIEKPSGGPDWQFRLQVNLLFPRG